MSKTKIAWRGVVYDGEVWAWPSVLLTHNQAHDMFPLIIDKASCTWRQWNPGEEPDFDPGATDADKMLVEEWVGIIHG